MSLTPKQARFIKEYPIDHNGRQSAIRAGYSPNGAEVTASRLLMVPKIAQELARREQKTTTRLELTAELVLNGLLDIAVNGEREANRVRSWELLGKHLALFADRLEVSHVDLAVAESRIDLEIQRLSELHSDIHAGPAPSETG